jgi:hypothetical protein
VETVTCDANANTCQIKVPAPGFALVFFIDTALTESNKLAQQTFATTVQTRTKNTATVDPGTLATSNGGRGNSAHLGSTSPEWEYIISGSSRVLPSVIVLAGLFCGGLMIGRTI